ncbi:MAG: hypothetical protein KDE19_20765 [Caldilineaceae bacterium]|nr:hypothetical protein [Caldilineaceae bacterium]
MTSETGKIIRNVATLDLRTATAETIAGIRRIDNVASIIYAAERADLLGKLRIGNVASMVKVPEGARVLMGQETLSAQTFQVLEEALDLYVVGQLTIAADVTADALRQGLNTLSVTGQLFYPEAVAGVVKSKLQEMSGQAFAYSTNAKIIQGRLTLTPQFLQGLADNTAFFVMGRLDATEVLPNELLAQKIEKIELMGRATCCAENADTLLARVENATRVTIIPAGFSYLPQPLVLDANLIHALPGKKLYGSTVRIEPDVMADDVDNAIEALMVTDQLIAPATLRAVLAMKCNLLETEHVLYEGELWVIEGETTLYADRFDYLEGKATLVVQGELMLAEGIEPTLLAQRLAKVHNWGEIHCTPAQMSALQARLGINKGEFVTGNDADEDEENVIGNAAYLVL